MYPNSNAPAVAIVDQEAVARARYFAYVQRRAMPPRCSPITILIIILSTGMMFIGVTMTIIANWPGATTIGENPLKIAGPVLLAVGGAIFVLGIILTCVLNTRERVKWEQNLTNLAIEHSNNVNAQQGAVNPPGAYTDTQPLTKPGNMGARSSGGGESGRDSESVPGYYSGGSNKSHPDPHQNGLVSQLPEPIRNRKSGPIPRGSGSVSGGSANVSSEIGAADLGGIGVYSPASEDKRRTSPNSYSNQGYSYSEFQGSAGEYGQKSRAENQRRPPQGVANGRGDMKNDASYARPGQSGPQEQQHLRVHIRAQPGTAVLITPSATPPRGTPLGTPQSRGVQGFTQNSRMNLSHGDSADETEI